MPGTAKVRSSHWSQRPKDNIGTGGIIDVLRYRPTNGLREFGYIDPSYAAPDEEALFTYTNQKSDIAINQQNKYAYNSTNAISWEWKPVKGLVLRRCV